MTKRDLVLRIHERTGLQQTDIMRVIQLALDYIIDALAKGERVEFRNFGVLHVRTTKQRVGRNPHHPEHEVTIPPRRIVKLKMGRTMKQKIMGAPAQK